MASPPDFRIFDRALLRRRRDRAAAGFDAHGFLVDHVAQDLLERLSAVTRPFTRALDLGAHTGALARLARQRGVIPALVSCDLSPAMARRAPTPALVADEEFLPIAPERFDLAFSALSLHWVNDLPGALIQINHALKPDGLFLGALFGGDTLRELRDVLTAAEIDITGGASPRVSAFTEIRDGGALLQRAGFALPVADSERLTVRYEHPLRLLAELRGMGETNVLLERSRTPLSRAVLMRACALYQERFALADGRIPATFEILYLCGWAPHESQQKPLRPGSARTRLADALGTVEVSTGVKAGDDS